MEPVVEEKGNFAFDLFQQTALHPGTPVAVLWESRNGDWFYLVSSLLRGWSQKKSIGIFEDKKELLDYRKGEKIIVVDRAVPFYQSPIGEPIGEWVMGTVFHTPFIQEEGDFYRIGHPVRSTTGKVEFSPVYVRKGTIEREFLPLTGRQIITQACKLNGSSYGWGGLKGGWDCSSFLRDLFLTMGVRLPRNSTPQSKVGEVLATFQEKRDQKKKKELLSQSLPGATFVKLDGHIMLYLGEADGRHYVIHSTAGHRGKGKWYQGFRDRVVSTFRVLISDMELGEGAGKGSLWERTVSMNAPFNEEWL